MSSPRPILPPQDALPRPLTVAVLGAGGGVGGQVVYALRRQHHRVNALVRRPQQAEALVHIGVNAVLGDLTGEWADVLSGADAVVWAAGASTSGRFDEIDGQALMQVADHLRAHGPRRLIVVSSLGVGRPDEMPAFLRGVLRVKAASDAHVQASGLAYTVVRPGGLTNAPKSGLVEVGRSLSGGQISRADVAAVVVACLASPELAGQTFEVVSGPCPVAEALAALTAPPD